MKYKILSHTADLRLEVFGKTIEELFKNAAEALAQILSLTTRELRIKNKELSEKISIESSNLNALLVDFLNEILAKSQINKSVYRIKNLELSPSAGSGRAGLAAEIEGIKVPEFHEDVKAVTYHEVDIKKGPATGDKRQSLWSTKLVIDI